MSENLELDSIDEKKIVIKGKQLNVRWLDTYILIWSDKEHWSDKKHY